MLKRNKGGKTKEDAEDMVDRISNLPDNILQHILFFLDTQAAARSSILSRRWRYVWTRVPCLDFGQCTGRERWVSLHGVYSAMLCHRSPTLRKFCMGSVLPDHANALNQWITFCLRFQLQELHLRLGGPQPNLCRTDLHHLPTGVFSCRSLCILKLQRCKINQIGIVDLPNLKYLSLNQVYGSDEMFQHLISGCPHIKYLMLKNVKPLTCLKISCLELQWMILRVRDKPTLVELDAPNLRLIEYGGYMSDLRFFLKNSPHLSTARVDCCKEAASVSYHSQTGIDRIDDDHQVQDGETNDAQVNNSYAGIDGVVDLRAYGLRNLLQQLGEAQLLKINCHVFKNFAREKSIMKYCPSQLNAKSLVLRCVRGYMVLAIAAMLKGCPKLEDLVIQLHPCKGKYEKDRYSRVQSALKRLEGSQIDCLQHCLKRIKIGGFIGSASEVELAKFLVQNAKVLEILDIEVYGSHFSHHSKIRSSLMSLRGSQSTEIMYT